MIELALSGGAPCFVTLNLRREFVDGLRGAPEIDRALDRAATCVARARDRGWPVLHCNAPPPFYVAPARCGALAELLPLPSEPSFVCHSLSIGAHADFRALILEARGPIYLLGETLGRRGLASALELNHWRLDPCVLSDASHGGDQPHDPVRRAQLCAIARMETVAGAFDTALAAPRGFWR